MANKLPPKRKSNKARAKPEEHREERAAPPVLMLQARLFPPPDPPWPEVPPPDPALRTLDETIRFNMYFEAASALGISLHEQFWLLSTQFSLTYSANVERPNVGGMLAVARILKATRHAINTGDHEWLQEVGSRAKAFLERNPERRDDLEVTRPQAALYLRDMMMGFLDKGATHENASELASNLLESLFLFERGTFHSVLKDIPDVPDELEIAKGRGRVVPGITATISAEQHDAFMSDLRRRDPWAPWPEPLRARCKRVSADMARVLQNTKPNALRRITAQNLVRAGLRALGYPEKKVNSLFAAPSTD